MRSFSYYFLFPIAAFLHTYCKGQVYKKQTSLAYAFADSVFNGSSFLFEEQQMGFSPEITDISLKFQAAVEKNKAWLQEYVKTSKPGQALPYHENFGISRDEYERYKRLGRGGDSILLKTASIQTIQIEKSNGVIKFKGEDRFSIFNYLVFDINEGVVTLGKDTLAKLQAINTDSPVFGKWTGYNWQFQHYNQTDDDLNIPTLTGKSIEINIGKRTSDNRLLLTLKLKRVENGVTKQLFDILGFIK